MTDNTTSPMNHRNRFWIGGAAALGVAVLIAGPLTAAAQDGDDWVSDALGGLVSDGTITRAQADAVDTALDSARPERAAGMPGEHGHGGRFAGPFGGHFGGQFGDRSGLDEAAAAIGVEPDALREDLRDGQTLAEVAEANGVETQAVIDAMVADVEARLTRATERITTFVNDGFPFGHHTHRTHRDDTDDTTDSTPPTTTG